MKKTKDFIQKQWELKFQTLRKRVENDKLKMIALMRKKGELELEKKIEKITKKKEAYLKKKALEYKRKAENEIRKLEGKPEKVYKQKSKTRNRKLQFAMDIEQENSKLRDTNENGEGFCISCNQKKSREELAGGHFRSRRIQSVCLHTENINAQCHTCNYTTGPRGDKIASERVQLTYKQNLIKKYGEEVFLALEEKKNKGITNPSKHAPSEVFLNELIPDLIAENERLWKGKSFYKPKRNWRKMWEKVQPQK